MYDLCIKNGTLVTEDNKRIANVYISDGIIVKIDDQKALLPSESIIDAKNKLVMPGFIDPHVHLNDPGLTESEDFYTGTCSAAAGGITTVLEHPLTFPLPSNLKNLSDKKDIAEKKVVVDYGLWGALTPDNFDDVENMIKFGAIAFKAFMPYSVEIPQIDDGSLLKHMTQLKDTNILFGIHCENDAIVRHCTEEAINSGTTSAEDYERGRPEIAEIEAVSRVALLAEATGCKTHVVHCSSPRAVDIVQSFKEKGVNISVETCAHYLTLNKEHLNDLQAFGICNPPLRSKENMKLLKEMMAKGKIDFLGSDHATYTFEEKEIKDRNIFFVPAGLTGIQTCFPLLYHILYSSGESLTDFVKLTSTNAAKRFGIYPKKGTIAVGTDADVVIIDPNEKWTIDENSLFYKMKWSPYMNWTLSGKIEKTIVRGTVVYDGKKICVEPGFGDFIRNGRC